MARRRWTLMILPEDQTGVRQLSLSRSALQLVLGCAFVVLAVLSSLAAGFLLEEGQELRAERLAAENRLLLEEIGEIREQMGILEGSLESLSERDEQYRLLAGLDPLDPDVKQAGIGGPGGEAISFATSSELGTLIRRANLLNASWSEATRTLEGTHERLRRTPSILPANGKISSHFSRSRLHPILDVARPHEGVDITAPRGTPIVATAAGRVIFSGRHGGYGNLVEIDHGWGITTRYAHASRLLVRPGQMVQRGERIADVGSTGLSTSPHVHYEVLSRGRAINPRDYMLDLSVIPD